MKKVFVFLLALGIVLGITVSSDAMLWDRSGGMIYDDVLNITWLQDANYAKTSGYDVDGRMTYANAIAWADQLVYGGFADWRLPTTTVVNGVYSGGYDGTTTLGFNITSSEMGYMYYVNLGNKGMYDTNGNLIPCDWTPNGTFVDGNNRTVSFTNLQADYYRTGTEYPNPAYSILFLFGNGGTGVDNVDAMVYSWAVRTGDVASAVPIPPSVYLLGVGLVGLYGVRRRFKK